VRLAFHDSSAVLAASANGAGYDELIGAMQAVFGCGCASRYVHVELVISDSDSDDKHAVTWSSVPKLGVRQTVIDITRAPWVVVPLPVLSTAHTALVMAAIQKMKGQAYDWWGILGFGLIWHPHANADKFCSEFVYVALQAAGMFPGVKAWRQMPADLYNMVTAPGWMAGIWNWERAA
jgi:hypothetical protein